jgi:hypothetical protein
MCVAEYYGVDPTIDNDISGVNEDTVKDNVGDTVTDSNTPPPERRSSIRRFFSSTIKLFTTCSGSGGGGDADRDPERVRSLYTVPTPQRILIWRRITRRHRSVPSMYAGSE